MTTAHDPKLIHSLLTYAPHVFKNITAFRSMWLSEPVHDKIKDVGFYPCGKDYYYAIYELNKGYTTYLINNGASTNLKYICIEAYDSLFSSN